MFYSSHSSDLDLESLPISPSALADKVQGPLFSCLENCGTILPSNLHKSHMCLRDSCRHRSDNIMPPQTSAAFHCLQYNVTTPSLG